MTSFRVFSSRGPEVLQSRRPGPSAGRLTVPRQCCLGCRIFMVLFLGHDRPNSPAGSDPGRPGRTRSAFRRQALASRRGPTVLPRAVRGGQRGLAKTVHPDDPRARPASVGCACSGDGAAAFLDHGRPLPWASLERGGAGPCLGREPLHHPPLPRPADRCAHGPPVPALACQPGQAPGQITQGLRA